MRNLNYLLILFLSVSLLQSCVKDPITDDKKGEAPELPALNSFAMPFDGFEDADTTGYTSDASGQRSLTTYTNWFYAATNVAFWHTVTSLNMIIPVASFGEAFKHQAIYEGDGVWLWAYDFNAGNDQYSAELRGEFIDSENVQWDMSISKAGSFQDVLWYSGVTAVDGSESTWILNHKPFNPETFLEIKYTNDLATDNGTLRYTNIIPNNPDNGDYIEYRAFQDGSEDFNRAYDVFRIQQDHKLEVQWNDPTNEGRVKSEFFYNDTDWHCWDSQAMDTDC